MQEISRTAQTVHLVRPGKAEIEDFLFLHPDISCRDRRRKFIDIDEIVIVGLPAGRPLPKFLPPGLRRPGSPIFRQPIPCRAGAG